MSKVRYIYNETNGSNKNHYNHWVELQAYDIMGNNISQGLTSIKSSFGGSGSGMAALTDGNVQTNNYVSGGVGFGYVILDLGQEYDLSSIRLWHYYGDARTYYEVIKSYGCWFR